MRKPYICYIKSSKVKSHDDAFPIRRAEACEYIEALVQELKYLAHVNNLSRLEKSLERARQDALIEKMEE